jgi:hypothetical protein
MTQSHRNANWNWNFLLQRNRPKFQSYSCKDGQTKSGKLKISKIFQVPGGITLAKINQLHQNANWNYLLQNNNPSFNPIAAKMAK